MTTYPKDPNAVLDYLFDWTAWLAPTADAIASVTWLLSPGLTKVSSSFTPGTASVFVSGGVLNTTEKITCRITTTGGRTDDRSIALKITDR